MLILMKHDTDPSEVKAVKDKVCVLVSVSHEIPGAQHSAVAVMGIEGRLCADMFKSLSGMPDVLDVTQPFKLVRLEAFRTFMERIRELGAFVGRTGPEEVSAEV